MDDGGRTPAADDWYARSFGMLYPVLYAHRSVEAARPEALFAVDRLGIGPDCTVLDLCCGNGRHMAAVSEYTRHLTGLDYSPHLLALARQQVPSEAGLVRGDMRHLPFFSRFDVVLNFFTSFGYFPAREENLSVAREVARVLRPEGRFFIDYLNAAHVRATLVPHSERNAGGYRVLEDRWIDEERRRVNKTTRVIDADREMALFEESVALYEEEEFPGLLREAGLEPEETFGGYDGAPVSPACPRLIVCGRKRGGHA